jgi:hypothetical protein
MRIDSGLPWRQHCSNLSVMKRRAFVVLGSIVALLGFVGGLWLSLEARKPRLDFAGFRYSTADNRWYADLRLTNKSSTGMHCDGYVCWIADGFRTNESLLDFQCAVGFEDKQVETWPLWFATWLDVKPGESAKLSLNFEPSHPPKRIGLRYSEIERRPNPITAALNKAHNYIHRAFRLKRRRFGPVMGTKVLWCPDGLVFPANPSAETQPQPAPRVNQR